MPYDSQLYSNVIFFAFISFLLQNNGTQRDFDFVITKEF